MKCFYFTLILAALLAFASQVEAICLETSCPCPKANTEFCGDGNNGCKKHHVYSCAEDLTRTCDWGPRGSCTKCNKIKCEEDV